MNEKSFVDVDMKGMELGVGCDVDKEDLVPTKL